MKLDLTNILTKLRPIKTFIAHFAVVIFIVSVAAIFGYMTLKIAHYSNVEPSDIQVQDTKDSLKAFKLDDTAVQKIKQLQDQKINIESLFDNGRANPFE